MNVQLKNYRNLPLVVLIIIGFSWSLARPVVGEDLGTFLTGLLITLLLFGSAGLKNLFKKMHAPIWFPFFGFVMMKLFDEFYLMIVSATTGNHHFFEHVSTHNFAHLHRLPEKLCWAGQFLFSAINEELLMIPIVLTMYILLKRTATGWYMASFLSSIFFAYLHYTVYAMNVWLVIGLIINRLVLNELFRLTNSLRAPMCVHFLNDEVGILGWML